MARLEFAKRAALSEVLRTARERLQWSQTDAALRAVEALREAAKDGHMSPADRRLCQNLVVTRHHVQQLENCPAEPLKGESRIRLMGLQLALGLTSAQVNRLAGGI